MESLKIFSWKIREAVDHSLKLNLKDLTSKINPSVICLRETKCSKWNKFMNILIWDVDSHGWLKVPANGLSGGLLVRNHVHS